MLTRNPSTPLNSDLMLTERISNGYNLLVFFSKLLRSLDEVAINNPAELSQAVVDRGMAGNLIALDIFEHFAIKHYSI